MMQIHSNKNRFLNSNSRYIGNNRRYIDRNNRFIDRVDIQIAIVYKQIAIVDYCIAIVNNNIAIVDNYIAIVDTHIAIVDNYIAILTEQKIDHSPLIATKSPVSVLQYAPKAQLRDRQIDRQIDMYLLILCLNRVEGWIGTCLSLVYKQS